MCTESFCPGEGIDEGEEKNPPLFCRVRAVEPEWLTGKAEQRGVTAGWTFLGGEPDGNNTGEGDEDLSDQRLSILLSTPGPTIDQSTHGRAKVGILIIGQPNAASSI